MLIFEGINMRENFSQDTIAKLAARAGYVCSFPGCHIPTSGPSLESATQTANTGNAAHICAASQGKGARRRLDISKFDKSLLSDYSNGIWMCETHAKTIDTDEVRFTVEMLNRWRELAELRAHLQQTIKSPLCDFLHKGNEVPLAQVNRSFMQNDLAAINEICDAVEFSYIYDVWGKDVGIAIRDIAGELLINAFRHGGATEFKIDINSDRVLITSDDRPFSFEQLLTDPQCHGGQQAAASLMKRGDRLVTAYRRENNSNILEITFITSQEQIIKSNSCAISFTDFFSDLSRRSELPDVYISCETIYIVVPSGFHIIPSTGLEMGRHLKELAQTGKKMVLICSRTSEDVISKLESFVPGLEVRQI
ncbi:hypothetical protein BG55_14000 [Erwinia mallotivora]|uniref:Uncharacterized protein n=2 Tax=Erwinia TaxID=551 RepID=A0A014NM33_9GAMM|nr:hypothetical protein BG55_14000 [Erwinia mallotivora]